MSSNYNLESFGFKNIKNIYRNLPVENLIEHEIKNDEVVVGPKGAMIVDTGKFTGRSPKDKFIVDEPTSTDNIWWGPVNSKITADVFDQLQAKCVNYLDNRELYMFDGFCGADKEFTMPVRIVTSTAWHSHFVRNMFIRPDKKELASFKPEFTILNACGFFEKEFKKLGLNSEVFVIFNLAKKLAIIGGTRYAGEMKKGIFSVMNYFLPLKGTLSMHCSANKGKDGDVALFFGLSGTGKTTLSTEPNRHLIGDDEHAWSEKGIFNLEGGCYAKCINLDPVKEPDIWKAIRHEAILENVIYDENRNVDFKDSTKTENTRVSYPIYSIDNIAKPSTGGHPKNIIFLTCDAFGVLPPVSKLTPEQASYHFLNGYTAKVAGTERGVTEPEATFSTCFGGPFMTLRPKVYADLLTKKMREHGTNAYLVNTGWSGGPYGVGSRVNIPETRAMITAILDGSILKAEWKTEPVFKLAIPTALPGVTTKILDPINTWSDKNKFEETRKKLAAMFIENFKKYEADSPTLKQVGPSI